MFGQQPIPRITGCSETADLLAEMAAIGVDRRGTEIMAEKGSFLTIKLRQVKAPAANILKQEMLAKGGEAAVSYGAIYGHDAKTDVLLMGNRRQFRLLLGKMTEQPFGLKKLGQDLAQVIFNYDHPASTWQIGRKIIDLKKRPLIMGILNVTPDSFYDGGRFASSAAAVAQGQKLLAAGADIIDIGGESSRPGSKPVRAAQEIARVIAIIRKLAPAAKKKGVLISIDTCKAKVAKAAVQAGAAIINDISGGRFDRNMFKVAAKTGAGLVLMHIQGRPKIMQKDPRYQDLMGEILDYLATSLALAHQAGVSLEKIVIDPGIGFGKTTGHNLTIIKRLAELKVLGRPIMLGPSRKHFIGKILKGVGPDERLMGTAAACALAVAGGARILRVHDPAEIKQAAEVALAISLEKVSQTD